MKKNLKIKIFLIIGIIILISLGLKFFGDEKNFSDVGKNFSNEEKNFGNEEKKFLPKVKILTIGEEFKKKFSTLGEVFPEQESTFLSKISNGIVKKIYVKNGDLVKKGQILMKIKSDEILQNYINAKNNYNKAVTSGNQNVKSAFVNLQNAENISKKQKIELSNNLSNSKLSINLGIEKAKSDLNSIISLNEKTENTAKENLKNNISSSKILSANSLNEIDKILGIENVNKENALRFKNYLGNLNTEIMSNANSSYRIAKKFFNQNENNFDIKDNLELLKKIKFSSNFSLELLKNSTTGADFTNNELQALISSVSKLSSSIQSSINSLISIKNGLNSTIESNNKNLISAQNTLKIMQNLNNTGGSEKITAAESSYEKNLENIKNSINIAKESLSSSKTSSQQNIASMLSNLRNTTINLKKLTIIADFDGEVSNVFVNIGENISNSKKLISISNNSKFKIITYLSKSQALGLVKGDIITIGKNSKDKIFSISSVSDVNTKKYKVEILHNNPFLAAGQFINVKFVKNSINNYNKILLNLPAIFITDTERFIWIVDEKNQIKKQNIELGGLSGNKIEITSGLKKGDKVIISGGRFLKKNGEKIKIIN